MSKKTNLVLKIQFYEAHTYFLHTKHFLYLSTGQQQTLCFKAFFKTKLLISPSTMANLVPSLQGASNRWKGFNWEVKIKEWGATAAQQKESLEQSRAARKHLAETTKQFKKSVKNVEQAGLSLNSSNSQENSVATVKAIEIMAKSCRQTVKAYQEEIDNLTRRCKSSESAFTSLTQSLGENPDPFSTLSRAMNVLNEQNIQIEKLTLDLAKKNAKDTTTTSSSSDSGLAKAEKEELMELRKEVAEYEVEFRSLKNQDITIRKLEAKIVELQTGGEEEFEIKLEKAREELAETEGRRTAEALEREAAMERKVQTLELQLKAEMAGNAATQAHLLEASEGVGEREAAWEAQRRILVDDSERLRIDLHEATRERDELRLKVGALQGGTKVKSGPSSGGIQMEDLLSERQAYEAEVSELAHTIKVLREEIALKDEDIESKRLSLQAKVTSLEQERDTLSSGVRSLQAQLAEAPSQSLIDSMKRELRILKRLEYNADDPELAERDPEMTNPENDLESVLVAKLRKVESELVKERNLASDAGQECEQLKQKISEMEKAQIDANKVIASLEADLDKAVSTVTSPVKSKSKASLPAVPQENPATLQRVLDPNAPPPPPPPPLDSETKVSKASAAEKAADDHSVATIIMAQRDRLRARCDALEAERDSFKRELQAQVDAAESLKTDNTKLFEKMRYLQSYKGNNTTARANFRNNNSRDLDLEALEQRYEASVDPFRQFGRAERQRKLNEMSPVERTVFVVSKTMLGSKEMRTFLFFYILAMHLLVFLTTYHWSHAEIHTGCSILDIEKLTHLPPSTHKTPEEIMHDLSGK